MSCHDSWLVVTRGVCLSVFYDYLVLLLLNLSVALPINLFILLRIRCWLRSFKRVYLFLRSLTILLNTATKQ